MSSLQRETDKIRSIKEVINKLKEYGFQPDLSLILETFEIAYGME